MRTIINLLRHREYALRMQQYWCRQKDRNKGKILGYKLLSDNIYLYLKHLAVVLFFYIFFKHI